MRITLTGMVSVAVLAATSGAALAEPTVLQMNNYEPPGGITNQQFYMPWVDRANEVDPDALEIEYFPGGGLGRDPTTQLEVVENGVADIAYVLSPYHAGRFPDNVVANFPFLGQNATETSLAFAMMYQDGVLRGYDTVVPLGLQASPVTLINANVPINSVADLEGLRVRAPDGVWARLMEALGAVPVTNIPVNQAAENLSRGVIDASLDNWVSIQLFGHPEVAPHAFVAPLGQVMTMVAINADSYDGLPTDARAALDAVSFDAYAQMWGEVLDGMSDEIEADLRADPDYTVVDFSAEDEAVIREAVDGLLEDWFADDPHNQVVYDAMTDALAEIRGE